MRFDSGVGSGYRRRCLVLAHRYFAWENEMGIGVLGCWDDFNGVQISELEFYGT